MLRRARLQIRFGVFAGLVAILYAGFFFMIGHVWGGAIIGSSGLLLALIPWLVRKSTSLKDTGYLYAAVLLFGLTGLCTVDGGISGSAVAWLAAVPLVVLLLVDLRAALLWSAVAFGVVVTLAACELLGWSFPVGYEEQWHSEVAAVSMVGMVALLAVLGLICEQNRQATMDSLNESNQSLAVANEQLEVLNRERAEFINIAAHGLRNPLGIVTGYADLMRIRKNLTPEEVEEQAGEILSSAGRMTNIISNLLDVQAIEQQQMELSSNKVDVSEILLTVIEENANLAERKDIELVCELAAELPWAQGDETAIHQILENVLSNGIKYTPAGGRIVISSAAGAGGTIDMWVRDSGPGLSEEDQQKLFGKFSRLTPRPTAGEASSGLGLWITRRLALAMEGGIECASQLGEGSTFHIWLPEATLANKETFQRGRLTKAEFQRGAVGRQCDPTKAQAGTEADGVALPS